MAHKDACKPSLDFYKNKLTWEVMASIGLVATVLSGIDTYKDGQEADMARGAAQIYTVQGNKEQADEWNHYADTNAHDRNVGLVITASNVATSGLSTVMLFAAKRRREEDESIQFPTQSSES